MSMRQELDIPYKTGRILNLVLLSFILIFLRILYLTFVQGDLHKEQARAPQRRAILEKVPRGTICDRFGIPFANNQMEYSCCVRYADIRSIAPYRYSKDAHGKKTKIAVRAEYISSLAILLSEKLHMDSQEIEDIIHAKASLFPHTPFVIKKGLSEKQYYELRMLQKDWIGIDMRIESKRIYPQGKVGCDLIGYMGAINTKEYLQIAGEIRSLQEYIQQRQAHEIPLLPKGFHSPQSVRNRLQELKEKSYTINDLIGKAGIEKTCDEQLRGIHGKRSVEVNSKGSILRQLPLIRQASSGQKIVLSLSTALQEYAEQLLAEHEGIRSMKTPEGAPMPGTPWIKGGAVAVLDPKTGEVLALASYPRFDPNDFVQSHDPFQQQEQLQSVRKWIESEEHIADIWEGKVPLTKELYSPKQGWYEDSYPLHWDQFIDTILPRNSPVRHALSHIHSIREAYHLIHAMEQLITDTGCIDASAIIQAYFPPPHRCCHKKIPSELIQLATSRLQEPHLQPYLSAIYTYLQDIPYNDDKLLLLDLLRLLMVPSSWDPYLLEKVGSISLTKFFSLSQSLHRLEETLQPLIRAQYHKTTFQQWRKNHFPTYLKQKRKEEKASKTYAKPYTEYLDKIENAQFAAFWQTHKHLLCLYTIYPSPFPCELSIYLDNLITPSHEIIHPIQSVISSLSTQEVLSLFNTIRPYADLQRPLYGRYRNIRNTKGVPLEKHLAASFYPIHGFGYGRSQAFRQSAPLGSIFKIVIAYEALKQRHQYLQENLLSLKQLNPLVIIDHLRTDMPQNSRQILGITEQGDYIRRLYKGGMLPRSHAGIGKIDLPQAIEQSSNVYFSLLAAEHIDDPSQLVSISKDLGFGAPTGIDLPGEIGGSIPSDLCDNKTGLYSFAIGQHSLVVTPLQTALMLAAFGHHGHILQPHLIRAKIAPHKHCHFLSADSFPFQEPLSLVGIHFPLFTETLPNIYTSHKEIIKPSEIRSIFLPKEIKQMLFDGLFKVVSGKRGTARPSIIRYFQTRPEAAKEYLDLKGQLLGKTSTAEIFHKPWIDKQSKATIHNHIWFGGLVFPKNSNPLEESAELSIVVYLRFSAAGGKEAAPIAAKLAQKWREIKAHHQEI